MSVSSVVYLRRAQQRIVELQEHRSANARLRASVQRWLRGVDLRLQMRLTATLVRLASWSAPTRGIQTAASTSRTSTVFRVTGAPGMGGSPTRNIAAAFCASPSVS